VWNTTDLSTSSQTTTTPHHAQKNHFLTLLKIVPLALYLRAAACKFSIPVLGCDGALCPVAIGKKGDCVPTANTAEQMAWCEHAWTPWTNGLLAQTPFDYRVKCSAKDNFEYLKILGAIEVVGYVLLWAAPQLGAFMLTAVMTGATHFHLTFLKDKPETLSVQFALLAASVLVFLLSGNEPVKKKAKKH
jgi:hypothetical protein